MADSFERVASLGIIDAEGRIISLAFMNNAAMVHDEAARRNVREAAEKAVVAALKDNPHFAEAEAAVKREREAARTVRAHQRVLEQARLELEGAIDGSAALDAIAQLRKAVDDAEAKLTTARDGYQAVADRADELVGDLRNVYAGVLARDLHSGIERPILRECKAAQEEFVRELAKVVNSPVAIKFVVRWLEAGHVTRELEAAAKEAVQARLPELAELTGAVRFGTS
jgi:uncharacterized protein (UPF0147 family)